MRFAGKILILTFKDTEEEAVEKAIAALAASLGRVFTKTQIFESVWSMDSKNPTNIKTVFVKCC